ncbi:TPA: PqqD family protein [Streptococcus agalactiae]|nr:MAG: PqqD family protein [Streptococcus sp.]
MLKKNIFVVEKLDKDVLYLILGQRVFVLNELAIVIWELINQVQSQEELLERIISQYDVPYDKAREDLRETLLFLQKADLIK